MTIDQLRISETFVSRQGEGCLAGTDSFFIRVSGCNLRCWFCDTPYASWYPEGESIAIERLLQQAAGSGVQHVVLTGGEPLLPTAVVPLVAGLRQIGLHVTIETAGTVFQAMPIDLVSISPKLRCSGPGYAPVGQLSAASQTAVASRATGDDSIARPYPDAQMARWQQRHEAARWRPEVIRQLIDQADQHQIKFVVDSAADFHEASQAADEIGVAAEHVWIMPQGLTTQQLDEKQQWLRPLCEAHRFQYCDRLHIRWYGNKRGT